MMTLQANSDLFFTFNLFYLIVFHLPFLGGEVITTLHYRAASNHRCNQDPIVSKTIVERDTFTKNILENVRRVTRN